ncbi:MAG: hypothetical protein AAF961_03565 [Planctomycetota bacterium]
MTPCAGAADKRIREGVSALQNAEDLAYVNAGKCQILHAGLDDDWGDFSSLSLNDVGPDLLLTFPDGPFTGALADTLTNFTTGTLEQAAE